MPARVLLVEDDARVSAFVRRGLEAAVGMHAGFHLGVAGTAALAAGNLGL